MTSGPAIPGTASPWDATPIQKACKYTRKVKHAHKGDHLRRRLVNSSRAAGLPHRSQRRRAVPCHPDGRSGSCLPRPPHRLGARDHPERQVAGPGNARNRPACRAGWQQTAERFLQILQAPALPGGERGQAIVNAARVGSACRSTTAAASSALTAAKRSARAPAPRTLPRQRVADGTEFRHPKPAEMKGEHHGYQGRLHKASLNTGKLRPS